MSKPKKDPSLYMKVKCDFCGKKINRLISVVEKCKNNFCSRKCYFDWKGKLKTKRIAKEHKLNEFYSKERITLNKYFAVNKRKLPIIPKKMCSNCKKFIQEILFEGYKTCPKCRKKTMLSCRKKRLNPEYRKKELTENRERARTKKYNQKAYKNLSPEQQKKYNQTQLVWKGNNKDRIRKYKKEYKEKNPEKWKEDRKREHHKYWVKYLEKPIKNVMPCRKHIYESDSLKNMWEIYHDAFCYSCEIRLGDTWIEFINFNEAFLFNKQLKRWEPYCRKCVKKIKGE